MVEQFFIKYTGVPIHVCINICVLYWCYYVQWRDQHITMSVRTYAKRPDGSLHYCFFSHFWPERNLSFLLRWKLKFPVSLLRTIMERLKLVSSFVLWSRIWRNFAILLTYNQLPIHLPFEGRLPLNHSLNQRKTLRNSINVAATLWSCCNRSGFLNGFLVFRLIS